MSDLLDDVVRELEKRYASRAEKSLRSVAEYVRERFDLPFDFADEFKARYVRSQMEHARNRIRCGLFDMAIKLDDNAVFAPLPRNP